MKSFVECGCAVDSAGPGRVADRYHSAGSCDVVNLLESVRELLVYVLPATIKHVNSD